jgi:hypothetical protein
MWCDNSVAGGLSLIFVSLPYMGNLHKYIILLKSGSPFYKRKLPLNHLFSESFLYWELSFQGSFKNSVVSTSLSRIIIDYMGFSGILQNTAVTNKGYDPAFANVSICQEVRR